MGFLRFLFPERRNSALIARDRLKIVLAHERANRDAPDFLPVLQQELLDVVGRYVEIRGDMIRVNLGRSGETSLLEINVEIDGARVKLPANGAAASAVPPPRPLLKNADRDADGEAPWVKPG
jgi:cell division topological specificity factor